MKLRLIIAAAALTLSGTLSASTAIIDSGTLLGFDNVEIDSSIYNVRFGNEFDYNTQVYTENFAIKATSALEGAWVADISLYGVPSIAGCVGGQYTTCAISTAANTYLGNSLAPGNLAFFALNTVLTQFLAAPSSSVYHPAYDPSGTYTSWTEVSAVPIPAAAFMFAPALLGLMGLGRKAKSSVA